MMPMETAKAAMADWRLRREIRVLLALHTLLDYDTYRPLKYESLRNLLPIRPGPTGVRSKMCKSNVAAAITKLCECGFVLRAEHPKYRGRGRYVYLLCCPAPVVTPTRTLKTA